MNNFKIGDSILDVKLDIKGIIIAKGKKHLKDFYLVEFNNLTKSQIGLISYYEKVTFHIGGSISFLRKGGRLGIINNCRWLFKKYLVKVN